MESAAHIPTGRFAPSPSGRMHLGNIWSGLLAWLSARSQGGRMVLRLEDLDPDRCTRAWCDQVMRDLEWLGLTWDNEPVYQSERTDLYAQAFRKLEEQGLIYPCYCTRAERLAASAPHRSDGQAIYDGRCRRRSPQELEELSHSRRPAWRVAVPEEEYAFRDLLQGEVRENLARDCGDFILRRSDGVYAYQLAVVVDDGDMGVTQVVRGSDLLLHPPADVLAGPAGPAPAGIWTRPSAAGRRRTETGQAGPGPGAGGAAAAVHRPGNSGPAGLYGGADSGIRPHDRPGPGALLLLGQAAAGGLGGAVVN